MGETCNKCKKQNHFAKMCRTQVAKGARNINYRSVGKNRKVYNIETDSDSEVEAENTRQFFVDMIQNENGEKTRIHKEEWRATVRTHGTDLDCKLDTGSEVNILLKSQYDQFKWKPKLHKHCKITLKSYSNHTIPILGSSIAVYLLFAIEVKLRKCTL